MMEDFLKKTLVFWIICTPQPELASGAYFENSSRGGSGKYSSHIAIFSSLHAGMQKV
jgi:hypothetical protein